MSDYYSIRFFKNGKRIDPKKISPLDSRLFFKALNQELKFFKDVYGDFLKNNIIVHIDGIEFFIKKGNPPIQIIKELTEKYKPNYEIIEIDGYVCTDFSDVEDISTIKII